MRVKNRKAVFFLLQLTGSIFFIRWIIKSIDFSAIVQALQKISITYFILYFLLSFLFLFLYVFRWYIVNSLTRIQIPFFELFKIYLISTFFSNFLPGSIGGDLYRTYILSTRTKSKSRSIINIIFERGTGLYVMFFLGGFVSLFYTSLIPHYVIWFFVGIQILMTLGAVCLLRKSTLIFLQNIKVLNRLQPVFTALMDVVEIAKEKKSKVVLIFLITIVYQFLQTIITILLYKSMGVNPNPWVMLSVWFLVFILVNIPISINGIGYREGLFVYFAPILNVTSEVALLVSFLFYISNVFISIIGFFFYLKKRVEHKFLIT